MNKLFILIFLLFLTSCSNNIETNIDKQPTNNEPRKILFELGYANWAWGYTYNGTVILNNGEIYNFDASRFTDNNDHRLNKKNLLNCLTEKTGEFSQSDLKKIKEYMPTIEELYGREYVASYDAGAWYVDMYNDSKNITLTERGDWGKNNLSPNTQKLLKIIFENKFLKEASYNYIGNHFDFTKDIFGFRILENNKVAIYSQDTYKVIYELTDIKIPKKVTHNFKTYKVTEIGYAAFVSCK